MQETLNTSGYMIAGYAIFFSISTIYLVSMIARWKNLQRDLETLEGMEE